MFGNSLHCYGYKVIQPSLRNSHLWTKRGKMGHHIKDSLGTERNSGQSSPGGGSWHTVGGSQHVIWVLLGRCVCFLLDRKHANYGNSEESWRQATLMPVSFCYLKGNAS